MSTEHAGPESAERAPRSRRINLGRIGAWLVLWFFILLTIFMVWQASHLKIDAGFAKLLPLEHPYMKNWWVPGCTIGYEHTFINSFADFLASLEGGPAFQPDMKQAMRTQQVCDAVLKSAKTEGWVEL